MREKWPTWSALSTSSTAAGASAAVAPLVSGLQRCANSTSSTAAGRKRSSPLSGPLPRADVASAAARALACDRRTMNANKRRAKQLAEVAPAATAAAAAVPALTPAAALGGREGAGEGASVWAVALTFVTMATT